MVNELFINDVGNDEAELTLDVVIPWPRVLKIMQVIDLSKNTALATDNDSHD